MSENTFNDDRFQEESIETHPHTPQSYYPPTSDLHQIHSSTIPFPTQQVLINPNPPDFTYLTPYTSSADLQHITPGQLYEIHYHYNNQSREQSEPHYPIIPSNSNYHPYNYPPIMQQNPSNFFYNNRIIAPIHPSWIPGCPLMFYPHYVPPDQYYASHFENNNISTNQQLLSEDEERTKLAGDENERVMNEKEPYFVEEPESQKTTPVHSEMEVTQSRSDE